jgi:DNA topoisomerase-2
MRFILGVVKNEIKVSNRKKKDIEADLKHLGFDEMTKTKAGGAGPATPVEGDEDSSEDGGDAVDAAQSAGGKGYDYLLSMPIFSLTMEKVQALCAERDAKQEEVDMLRGTTAQEMWTADLDSFLVMYEDVQEEERESKVKAAKQQVRLLADGRMNQHAPRRHSSLFLFSVCTCLADESV